MGWETSTRADRLPPDWYRRRGHVKKRAGGQCELVQHGIRCPLEGSQCDHIIPNDDHSYENLQWLCTGHHKQKTQQESAAARWKTRENRPPEKHPRWN